MSNNSVVEHRANYYFVEFREEFLIICMNSSYKKPVKNGAKSKSSPHCKALILAILENWTNSKRGRKEDLAIFMTYRQWIDSMYGMFGRTVIIDSLDELIGDGLLSREPYKMLGNKDTYKYLLNYQELNNRLRQLPERDLHDTRPKVDASTNDPSKSKPDASTSKPVTRPKVDAYPSKSGHNIESTQIQNIESQKGSSELAQSTSKTTRKQKSSPPSLSPIYEAYDFCIINLGIVPNDYRTPQIPENDRAMQMLADQGTTRETLLRVIKSLRDDSDDYYRKSINPGFVAKHYAARVGLSSNGKAPRKSVSQLRDLRSLGQGGN